MLCYAQNHESESTSYSTDISRDEKTTVLKMKELKQKSNQRLIS